ncbi:baeRF7 domain-containing protein [Maribellus mangrovi]|uniref:baeRF7 domain-containing protein n=1 Tax=Maribellus mangrovi TaxID=3133146 RepID=UPI0030EF3B80
MTLLTKNRFENLANERSRYCTSIYIPTERGGNNKKNKLRLKNKLVAIEVQLSQLGMKTKEVDKYLEPLNKLLEDSDLWRHLSDALIIFRNTNDFNYTTLPLDVEEMSIVSDRYYLLPLLSMFNENATFYLLVLSQKHNRLYEATKNEISEYITENVLPEKLEDTVGKDVKQKSLQFRSGQSQGGLGLYHGKGEGKDDKKKEIIKYLKDVDKGLKELMEGNDAPLVVASVDYIFSLFKEVSGYKNIYPVHVSGNYDESDILLVHEKACEVLQPFFEKERVLDKEKYSSDHDKVIFDIKALYKAANAGRIDTLFVQKGEFVWGKAEPELGKIQVHEEKEALDNCLLDAVARQTFLKGGTVFREEISGMPEHNSPAGAILRY